MNRAERFWSRVEKTADCWLWTGSRTTAGYGNLRVTGDQYAYAHRFSYELTFGPIPSGMHLDHLCRVRHCVNPNHLEPVTPAENSRRGQRHYGALRTRCKNGHDITIPENVYTAPRGDRRCRACGLADGLRRRERRQAVAQ